MSSRVRWSVIGGDEQARRRVGAILKDPHAELVGVLGAAVPDGAEVRQYRQVSRAIEECDAVVFWGPTRRPDDVRGALLMGRHVVVQSPLAESVDECVGLFEASKHSGNVLHVAAEDLLGGAQRLLRATLRVAPRQITVELTRPGQASVASAVRHASSFLHRVADFGGDFASVERLDVSEEVVSIDLRLSSGTPVHVRVTSDPYSRPRDSLGVVDASGVSWRDGGGALWRDRRAQTLLETQSVADRDHRIATGRIQEDLPGYLSNERVIHVARVADAIRSTPPRKDAVEPDNRSMTDRKQ